MEGELHDWELLQNSDDDDYDIITSPAAAAAADDDFSREEYDESESGIRSDYFSLDSNHNNNNNRYDEATNTEIKEEGFVDEQGSVQSDNPSWLDPSSQGITFENKHSPEFWSDSASDGSCSSVNKRFEEEEEGLECKHDKIVGSPEFWSDSGGEMVEFGSGGVGIETDLGVSAESDGGGEETPEEENGGVSAAQVVVSEGGGGGGDKRGGNVWWKLPLELLKFCVFRVSPVWSVSIAVAVVGFVILKRRLYKMKHKTQRIALNVTLEDNKKVSQFMARAARLNEAFSVVKRVPVIRPSLPAAGLTPWPVMSLR
ncbi:hypothetical protein MKW94_007975 [Papaver nudicaule]|uniref:DUF6821 domain-containing protein n=1 Tax=Papaver nudicaule TaxID=74823 RepID=A0AA42AWT4_PAPNU|nr:hypothetical protein [Papaver nudicaule]